MENEVKFLDGRKLLAVIMVVAVLFSLFPIRGQNASVSAREVDPNQYNKKTGSAVTYTGGSTKSEWFELSGTHHSNAWYGFDASGTPKEEWYVLSDDAETNKKIDYGEDFICVYGTVNLVLSDGYQLNADTIMVTDGATLNIYGGTWKGSIQNSGSLNAYIGAKDTVDRRVATATGTVNVYGGKICATGKKTNPGIAPETSLMVQTTHGIYVGTDASGKTFRMQGKGTGTPITVRDRYMEIVRHASSGTNSYTEPSSFPPVPSSAESSGSTTEHYTIPVKSENTVKVEAEIKENNAVISEITEADIAAVTKSENTQGTKETTVSIVLSGAEQKVTSVELSKTSLERLEKALASPDNSLETVTIEMTNVKVEMDVNTLAALVGQAGGTSVKLVVDNKNQTNLNTVQKASLSSYEVANTFEAYFESDGNKIHDFNGGKVALSMKFTPAAGKDEKYYHVYYVAEDGKMTRFQTACRNHEILFTTTHFSDYVIIYDTTLENETYEKKPEVTAAPVPTPVPEPSVVPAVTATPEPSAVPVPSATPEPATAEEKSATNGKTVYENGLTLNSGFKVYQPGAKLKCTWGKVSGADRYEVFIQYCGSKFKTTPTKVTKKNAITITKLNGAKLNLKKNYKIYVAAYKTVNGTKNKLGKTVVAHVVGRKNVKFSNPKKLTVKKSSYSLKKGKTAKISASVVLVDNTKKSLSDAHAAKFRYASSNKKIAVVNKNGKITAKKAGTCIIYVYAKNGYAQKVKVTVK